MSKHWRLSGFCLSALGLLLFAKTSAFAQKVTTKVSVYNEIFLTDSGFISLPENAIELECDTTVKSEFFSSPLKLALDSNGNIYVTSWANHSLVRYSFDGKSLGQLGIGTNAKSFLKGPEAVEVVSDQIVVYERFDKRISFLDLQGRKLASRKIPELEDFSIDRMGNLFIAPLVDKKESPLVRCYSKEGRILEYGKPLVFAHSMQSLNARSIVVRTNGDVYIAFRYFPIVRRYSSEGNLLSEYRISSPTMEAKEKYNLKAIGEGIIDTTLRSQYKPIIVEIESYDNAVFLISHNPRLEITELDESGTADTTYWMDSREIYFASDLAVRDIKGEKIFYVAHSCPPEYSIDVLRIKRQLPAGLDADIQRWTEEIGLYPENSLAYINRGMARHLKGEYSEAIIDFTAAINLDPASSVAHNNRGLSKVKTRDFSGAVNDLSRAIELDPKIAAVHFNRGIARIHNNELKSAIEDFKTAARIDKAFETRANEQIEYCRSRLIK